MPGLYLNGSANAKAAGSYTPMMPASASSPSAANVGEAAFGVGSISAGGDKSSAAGMGSVSVGAIALALMVFIWYSLPR